MTNNINTQNNISDKAAVYEYINSIQDEIKSYRRTIHKNPELSFNEYETAGFICKKLDEFGVSYESGVAKTGIIAEIKGEKDTKDLKSAKTLLIRADMDALPIDEVNNAEYKSQNPGVMHACGHDAHTAILLGVCNVLNEFKKDFSGYIKLIFQPGEETDGGALPMIKHGVLEEPKVDAALALHVDPDIEKGKIRIKKGSLYASPDDFKIVVKGRGGHGAEPHKCVDPVTVAAHIIVALNSVTGREIDPFDNAVITVGSIHGGTATNIIPNLVEIKGTARSLTNETRKFIKNRIGETANQICSAFGAECDYEYTELFPPLINDEGLCDLLYLSAVDALGEEKCITGGTATMAGEDFAYFSQSCPSVLFKLGCRNEEKGITNPIHHSSFDIDEECLKCGVSVFSAFAMDYLK